MSDQTMIERLARTLWETNALRLYDPRHPVFNCTWDELKAFRHGPDDRKSAEANVYFHAMIVQAQTTVTAMREPTMSQVFAAADRAKQVGTGDFVALWETMIDAALAEA